MRICREDKTHSLSKLLFKITINYILPIHRLSRGDTDVLGTGICIDGVVEDRPEAKESTQSTFNIEILHKGSWVSPVLETVGMVVRTSTTGDNEGHQI